MIMLCYHELADAEVNPWTIAPRTFRDHLAILSDHGYGAVTLDEAVSSFPCEERTVVISFDDGREGCVRFAVDALNAFGFVACFYICTGFVDSLDVPAHEAYSRFVSWNDVRTLAAAGHTIGSHAVTHTSFRNLSALEQREELSVSKSRIEEQIGNDCRHFAAPYGFLDRSLIQLGQEVGYLTLASTLPGVNRLPSSLSCLKRWSVDSPCDGNAFENALLRLEKNYREFRVLVLSIGVHPGIDAPRSLERLSTYDLILTRDAETQGLLARSHIPCIDTGELFPESRDREIGCGDFRDDALVQCVKRRCDIASDCDLRFEFA